MPESSGPGAPTPITPPSVEETQVDPLRRRAEPLEIGEGTTLGRYHVLRKIGSGGMGIVFEAYDPDLRGQIDARSDQFAWCVALFEALYGRRPFDADTTAALAVAVCDGAISPRPSDTAVPRWIHAVIVRGLAAEPSPG